MFNIKAFFSNISIVSHLIPLLLFFVFYARNKKKDVRVIFCYCLYTFINELFVTDQVGFEVKDDVTYTLLSAFTIVEYVLFSYTIYLNLKTPIFRRLIMWLSLPFLIVTIILFLNKGTKTSIDSIAITIEYILLITYSLFWFFEELNQASTRFIYSTYQFWIVMAILLYPAGTFFFFMQSDTFSDDEWDRWLMINYIFTIIKNGCFAVAMAIQKKISDDNFHNPYDELFEKPLTPL